MLAGRDFHAGASGGVDPIGKTFRTIVEPHYPAAEYQIIGLIRNTRYFSLRESGHPIAYGSIAQYPPGPAGTMLYILSAAPLPAVEAAGRRRVAGFQQRISESLMRERVLAILSGFFGALAALLARRAARLDPMMILRDE